MFVKLTRYFNTQASQKTIPARKIISLNSISPIKAYVDFACIFEDDVLALVGWVFDPDNYVKGFVILSTTGEKFLGGKTYVASPLVENQDGVKIIRVVRPDVAQAMPSVSLNAQDVQHGFILVIPKFPDGADLALSLNDGRFAKIPYNALRNMDDIKSTLQGCFAHSGVHLIDALQASLGKDHSLTTTLANLNLPERKIVPLNSISPIKADVDFACIFEDDVLALVGWVFDPDNYVKGFAMLSTTGEKYLGGKTYVDSPLVENQDGVRIIRVVRRDVAQAMSSVSSNALDVQHGFILVIPKYPGGADLALSLNDGRFAKIPYNALKNMDDIKSTLQGCFAHSGVHLIDALQASLGKDHSLTSTLANLNQDDELSFPGHSFMSIDQSFLLSNNSLILDGWIAKINSDIEKVILAIDKSTFDITSKMTRYMRPDLFTKYPWSEEEPLGFFYVFPDNLTQVKDIRLDILCKNGLSKSIKIWPKNISWPQFEEFVYGNLQLASPLFNLLRDIRSFGGDPLQLAERIASLQRDVFLFRHSTLPSSNDSTAIKFHIDSSYPLGEGGILFLGWKLLGNQLPKSVFIYNEDGQSVDISNNFVKTIRQDVSEKFAADYPGQNDWVGFICLAPMPTLPGETRALCFDFGILGEVWVKVPTIKNKKTGVSLIKEILGEIASPDLMRHRLYDIFSSGLGAALEAIHRNRPLLKYRIEERQYNIPNENEEISVIVPLYGRNDFLRYQLAHFVDDPDFDKVDLIYVIDDPSIIFTTIEMATMHHQLFGKPFRVIWTGYNLGYGGANNVGASVARAETLVLLNSDVIPQAPGWLNKLQTSLDSIPDAGAVGPLLQFADNAVQHAGMQAKEDIFLPGFLMNSHPGKGGVWGGADQPTQHPLLTAACLMLHKKDFLAVGGFDEGYVIGDFEDSDLCLSLRKLGKTLWLVPEAKLWHLERQSQNLESISGVRQLITLYNGWRYHQKIVNGQLINPSLQDI